MRRILGIVLALTVLAGCSESPQENAPPPARSAPAGFTVSYAGAASRLAGLNPGDTQEQLRDFARFALAARLELDTAKMRDSWYDTFPVRDPAFSDLASQPTGAGRAIPADDVLHLLVPQGDPRAARTIGKLLDQHRTDSGADLPRTRIHHYMIDTGARTIAITSDEPKPTGEVRSANGYVSMRIDERKGLAEFLARTRQLSTMEVRGAETWADGWAWPDDFGAALTEQDVSVLHRGYRKPVDQPRPGFSLDPGPAETADDVRAALPGLRPDLADRVISGNWAGTGFKSVNEVAGHAEAALHGEPTGDSRGLPTDRVELWALLAALQKNPVYSQARYDGGLAGTGVGMTLFYTDYVAKSWVNGTGSGVPAKAVEGFVPDSDAVTPWSHCRPVDGSSGELGRLWFGQNDSAFAVTDNKISLGAQSTRLFARTDSGGGVEVETSYAFGRGLRWWDDHYQAVSDYESEYRRLDQIMRWSGALEWLASKTSARIPQLSDSEIKSDLKFADWYAGNNALKERAQIRFVRPPSATQEAVAAVPSKSYENCGARWISGGVSLSDHFTRTGGNNYRPNLPASYNRAGTLDAKSTADSQAGTADITRIAVDSSNKTGETVTKKQSKAANGDAVVETTATGRRTDGVGGVKVTSDPNSPRQLGTKLGAGKGHAEHGLTYRGNEVGTLIADKSGNQVRLTWWRGVVERTRTLLENIQAKLAKDPGATPSAKDGSFYTLTTADGTELHRVGGPDASWLAVDPKLAAPGEIAFRIGAPGPNAGKPKFFDGRLRGPPNVPGDKWMSVSPATGDHVATIALVNRPEGANTIKVTTKDGKTATLLQQGDKVFAPAKDPLVGANGTVEGAVLLAHFDRVQQRHDGPKAVLLGNDAMAFVDRNEIQLVPLTDPWAAHVLQAIGPDTVSVRFKDGQPLTVDSGPLDSATRLEKTDMQSVYNRSPGEWYIHESARASLSLTDGAISAGSIPHQTKVKVKQATASGEGRVRHPDIRVYRGAEWLRGTGGGNGPGGGGSGGAPPSAGGGINVPVFLVCLDDNQPHDECED